MDEQGDCTVIGAIGSALGDDTDQDQESEATEPDPEQGTERDDNDSDEDEANSGTDNQGSTAEAETEESPEGAQELPADIDAQVEALGDLEAFEGGEVFHRTPEQGEIDHAIFIGQEYEPASFVSSTLCTYAREDTIEALEFARDNITEDYDRIQMEFISRGEPEATGKRPIVGLATLNYERETVEAIDSDHVSPANVWEARDEGSLGPTCR